VITHFSRYMTFSILSRKFADVAGNLMFMILTTETGLTTVISDPFNYKITILCSVQVQIQRTSR
jgi:hypothetical protein